ncbi:MAG: hypothetical protein OEV49_06565 [candidate division Zixibacteria bacterium]|nr:hypothetical protein [candidate division Zixibacteria bacterium]MDH3935885.1 hypothetical protein [candidate division Zixibacteria bacterium]MDH4032689.1 hypothetical protein [candidate division Zixibacteria bacterium]
MKILRVVIAVILTAVLLYIARTTSRGRPEFITHTDNGYTFEMTTVPKAPEQAMATIQLKITGDMGAGVKPMFRQSKFGQDETTALHKYISLPLLVEDSAAGLYYSNFSTLVRGDRFYYYFEIRDGTGGLRATFTPEEGKSFFIKFIGEVPPYVIGPHIFLMFATVFCVVMAFLHSFKLLSGGTDAHHLARYIFLAVVASFLGGYPWGFAMNYYAFGGIWEGVPFGTDATDNKTQLLFLYLAMIWLVSLGSLSKGKRRDLYSPKTLGWFGLTAFALLMIVYLIPHSIQFSAGLTYGVCYGFIGLVGLIYLIGWVKAPRKPQPAGKKRRR